MIEDPDEDGSSTVDETVIATERPPQLIEQQVLGTSSDSHLDMLLEAMIAADWLLGRAKSIHHLSRQIAIAWIERNGEFEIGDMHYSVAYNTTTRCTDTIQCGRQLLESLKGDFESFLQVLVAQPYKSGSVKRLLEAQAYRHLFVIRPTSMLIAGVPERVLRRTDKRFAP